MLQKAAIKTPRHKLKLECHYSIINVKDVKTQKELFSNMCKSGCKNFNKKYSCPPCSPGFHSCTKGYALLLVLLLRIRLNQLKDYRDYHKLRVGNAVIKPRIEKVMRALETNNKFLGTGACRLCKPCKKALNKPCRYPDKMRFSLESLGVDCNQLTEDVFNFPLLWYKDKTAPEYTSVVCALPVNDENILKKTKEAIEELVV